MQLARSSVRRVEDITEALWGTRVTPSTVSNLNQKIYAKIEAWRNRRIEGEHPYLYLDGIVMKRSWAGEVRNVSLLVASAVNSEGFREILGICEGAKEDKSGWSAFLRHLVDRGLKGVQLVISDACRGLVESVADFLPEARYQRCMVHFYRNVFSHVPSTRVREVSHMLKAIHAQQEPGGRRQQGTGDRRRPAGKQDGQSSRPRRAGRPRDPDLLWLPGHSLAEDPDQQSAGADHERDPA
jgi:putative transposase